VHSSRVGIPETWSTSPQNGKPLSAKFLGRGASHTHTHLSSPTSVRLQYSSGTIRAASCGVEIKLLLLPSISADWLVGWLAGWLCKMSQRRSPHYQPLSLRLKVKGGKILLTFWPDGIPSGSPPRLHHHQCAPIFILFYPTDALDWGYQRVSRLSGV
jgi:hypothetical protein